jgi:hypothetical protein
MKGTENMAVKIIFWPQGRTYIRLEAIALEENLQGSDCLNQLGIDGIIILKSILEE